MSCHEGCFTLLPSEKTDEKGKYSTKGLPEELSGHLLSFLVPSEFRLVGLDCGLGTGYGVSQLRCIHGFHIGSGLLRRLLGFGSLGVLAGSWDALEAGSHLLQVRLWPCLSAHGRLQHRGLLAHVVQVPQLLQDLSPIKLGVGYKGWTCVWLPTPLTPVHLMLAKAVDTEPDCPSTLPREAGVHDAGILPARLEREFL